MIATGDDPSAVSEAQQHRMRAAIANISSMGVAVETGVNNSISVDDVTISITLGSLRVRADVLVPSNLAARAAIQSLEDAISTPEAMTNLLGDSEGNLTFVTTPTFSRMLERVEGCCIPPSPPPPSPPPLSPPPPPPPLYPPPNQVAEVVAAATTSVVGFFIAGGATCFVLSAIAAKKRRALMRAQRRLRFQRSMKMLTVGQRLKDGQGSVMDVIALAKMRRQQEAEAEAARLAEEEEKRKRRRNPLRRLTSSSKAYTPTNASTPEEFREHGAAKNIQKNWAKRQERKEQNGAASAIQAKFRKKEEVKKENKAASKIQQSFRGKGGGGALQGALAGAAGAPAAVEPPVKPKGPSPKRSAKVAPAPEPGEFEKKGSVSFAPVAAAEKPTGGIKKSSTKYKVASLEL